ncbi:hypothetical protein [Gordonia caeni]|uniref:Uncharacterized protein n=1 Tax=Gordonia caeni TaxID=1007097 RepID=A0ABP7PIX2_9ACTN
MISPSRILLPAPRHLYGHMRDYHRARPGHDSRPQDIVTGIQEDDTDSVPGDLLAEWDVLFYPRTADPAERLRGDVIARRVRRRDRHSRTSVLAGDSHPVILLATDIPLEEARQVWRRTLHSAEHDVTLSDIMTETETDFS